jgi:hypothetical protein
VVEAGDRPRLVLEALQLPRVHRRRERQHLQRHAPVEGNLLRLVNDAHAAAADLADEAEVAQLTQLGAILQGRDRPGHRPQGRGQAVELVAAGEELLQLRRQVRVAGSQLREVRRLPSLGGAQVSRQHFAQALFPVARR